MTSVSASRIKRETLYTQFYGPVEQILVQVILLDIMESFYTWAYCRSNIIYLFLLQFFFL